MAQDRRPQSTGWPGSQPTGRVPSRFAPAILLTMVLVIAAAGLVYELVIAAVASYVLGDSVTQFSTIIGVYLSALGLGAYLSRFVDRRLAMTFVNVELATAVIGGLSAPGLFVAFAYSGAFHLILYSTVVLTGVLVGLELPLLIRILRSEYELKELIARTLTFDYAGALVGSLAFSLLLVPRLGLVQTSLACGLLNALVALASTWVLAGTDDRERKSLVRARWLALAVSLVLLAVLLQAERLTSVAEAGLYQERVMLAEQSPYQRIVLAESGGSKKLYLNGNLQFSSADEHRYHEALVHPAMATAEQRKDILIGGGGDGLAVREVLKWPEVERVTVVDLDRRITDLARFHPDFVRLNHDAFNDPRVRIINADAMVWFAQSSQTFDVVILDFPDPSNFSLGKLYSRRFYRTAAERLRHRGALVVQSTSPLFARAAYWCVVSTLRSAGFVALPYHVFIPSFGEWGYVLATPGPAEPPRHLPALTLRFLDSDILRAMLDFPPDMSEVPAQVNRLNNQALVGYYLEAWRRWN